VVAPAAGNLFTQSIRNKITSAATLRGAQLCLWRGNSAGLGGFYFCMRGGIETLQATRRMFMGLYDFPAEHWKHLRTSDVIESASATVRHRTVRAKGCLSNKTALAMIFKLAEAAERSWRRLDGHNQLPKVILGIKFTDGIEVVRGQAQAAAA
jgi:hypothetical protein